MDHPIFWETITPKNLANLNNVIEEAKEVVKNLTYSIDESQSKKLYAIISDIEDDVKFYWLNALFKIHKDLNEPDFWKLTPKDLAYVKDVVEFTKEILDVSSIEIKGKLYFVISEIKDTVKSNMMNVLDEIYDVLNEPNVRHTLTPKCFYYFKDVVEVMKGIVDGIMDTTSIESVSTKKLYQLEKLCGKIFEIENTLESIRNYNMIEIFLEDSKMLIAKLVDIHDYEDFDFEAADKYIWEMTDMLGKISEETIIDLEEVRMINEIWKNIKEFKKRKKEAKRVKKHMEQIEIKSLARWMYEGLESKMNQVIKNNEVETD